MAVEKSKYQLETDAFRKAFGSFRDKRIALYGIGRRTLTLLPGLRDFHVVGLLDRDAGNLGKTFSGIPIISLAEAEACADVIIINSDPTNFQIIYQRIADTHLPVYYATGEQAKLPPTDYADFAYWDKTEAQLREQIRQHDIVTFDFFDTLAMRRCLDPTDVFRLLEHRLPSVHPLCGHFAKLRQEAACGTGEKEPTLSAIYQTLARKAGLSADEAANLRKEELQLEEELCLPRKNMVKLLRDAMALGKDVYIISDTWLEWEDFHCLLERCGLGRFPRDHVWLSSEHHESKSSGALWRTFRMTAGARGVLHIGDDVRGDVVEPQKAGIDVFPIRSAKDMLGHSNISQLLPMATTLTDALHLGLIAAEACNDPFALAATRGRIDMEDAERFGYIVFGSAILRYLCWVMGETQGARHIAFFARDGYFLKQNFDFLRTLLPEESSEGETLYIPASRRLLYLATLETEEDLRRAALFPYTGTFADYLESRFEVAADARTVEANDRLVDMGDEEALLHLVWRYEAEIRNEARRERRNYERYLAKLADTWDRTVTVDLGYYGTNQYYFQKIIGRRVKGCYFYACYLPENAYLETCELHCCYNDASDPTPARNPIKQKSAFMESFLTAPYGMIRFVDDDGSLVCEPDKSNQRHFDVKRQVNAGIQRYMRDFVRLYGKLEGGGIGRIEGKIYREFLSSGSKIALDILKGFYFDNDMVGSREMPLET